MNNAVLITAYDDDAFKQALLAGFEIVGTWRDGVVSYPGPPPPVTKIAMRKNVPTYLEGYVDTFKGQRAPEKWFS